MPEIRARTPGLKPEVGLTWGYLNREAVTGVNTSVIAERLACLTQTLVRKLESRPKTVTGISLVLAAILLMYSVTVEQRGPIQIMPNPAGSEQSQSMDYGVWDWNRQYPIMAEALLKTPGLNMAGPSFIERMEAVGYKVGPFRPLISPVILQAGRDGLLPRRFPTSDSGFNPIIPGIEGIDWGKDFPVYGTIAVKNPNGSTEYYGLSDPWRVTLVIPGETSAPNVWNGEQYEPVWVRLGEQGPDGRVVPFLEPSVDLQSFVGVR